MRDIPRGTDAPIERSATSLFGALANSGIMSLMDDVPFSAMMFLGFVPPLAVMFWVNWRAFGQLKAPIVEDTPLWRGALVIVAGMATVLVIGIALAVWGPLDERSSELLLAYFIGLAFTGPIAAFHLWAMRRWWRAPGSFWETYPDLRPSRGSP